MSAPRTSVIVPAFNSERWIAKAVDSALAQTSPPFEVVVVDDGSTDGTADALAKYGDSIKIIATENRGVAAARNTAIDNTSGDWIAFLDADDKWAENKLERIMKVAAIMPNVDLFHHDMIVLDDLDNEVGLYRMKELGPDPARKLMMGNGIITSSAVVRAEKVRGVLRFKESFRKRAGCEDWDFWIRFAATGKISHLSEPLGFYRRLDASATRSSLDDLLLDCLAVVRENAPMVGLSDRDTARALAEAYRDSSMRRLTALDGESARTDLIEAGKLGGARTMDELWIALSQLHPSLLKKALKYKRRIDAALTKRRLRKWRRRS